MDTVGLKGFSIVESDLTGAKGALILPDIATCPECLAEIGADGDRRYRYPFTNCTNCGPRFSIIESPPYDRSRTTMKGFTMCAECRDEYRDPGNRRYHAQPNACPRCGPRLRYLSRVGVALFQGDDAMHAAVEAVRAGRILAVKGLGGFHLVADARDDAVIRELRRRKHRHAKPFALMHPDLSSVKLECRVSVEEERLLLGPEAPIVLLEPLSGAMPSPAVAGESPDLGVMLPYTPLHHLLLGDLGFPVVATSGNLSGEPICTDETEALARLQQVADFFLVHDRPIARHVDDSVVRVVCGSAMLLRRARGYAPLPICVNTTGADGGTVLAVGSHQKNAVAITGVGGVFTGQHIGDLETVESYRAFARAIEDLSALTDRRPDCIACDLHPDYASTQYAVRRGIPFEPVQHHHAHVAACMAENDLDGVVLGAAWDGSGFGTDGTIWGGEFLECTRAGFHRVARLRPFPLPGGEAAVREPRRAALGLLFELFGEAALRPGRWVPPEVFSPTELAVLGRAMKAGTNTPRTSSAGRLFDAVASILGLLQVARFEGQAAMLLEGAARRSHEPDGYPFRVEPGGGPGEPRSVNWGPAVSALLGDRERGVPVADASRKFHNTLVEMIARVSTAYSRQTGCRRVVLSGGCFQNRVVTEGAVSALEAADLVPYRHRRIPPNDGGIAPGQAVVALARAAVASGEG
jgi:hydrogenase maturation protein HypF